MSRSSARAPTQQELQRFAWFHGHLSRERTEKVLADCDDGTFIIRNSTNFPGDFTLCVSYRGKVEHYRIYQINDQYSCDKEELFDNLTQLISHYKRDADGLCHRLISPLVSEAFKLACLSTPSMTSRESEEFSREFDRAKMLLSMEEMKLGDIIGHGEFGDVLLGHYKGKRVAVKTLKNGDCSTLLNEAKFMISLRHEHLVGLVGVVIEGPQEVYMLTELMANGNLVDFLRSRGRHQVERTQLVEFALNVADGMAYMEARRLVHRDLAARNVLLDGQLVAKVSDFGLAAQVTDQPSRDAVKGSRFPVKWTAPEALRNSLFTNKSDTWSFGVLLWELFSFGRVPYPRIPIQDVIRHIEKGYRMEPPEGSPPGIIVLMNECWNLEAVARPTFTEICSSLKRLSIDANGSL